MLLRQNRELRADNVWNWTLPAFAIRLTDGRTLNVCPNAGACASVCYARNGTFLFRNVKAAHERNLLMVLDHLDEWEQQMQAELAHKRFRPRLTPRVNLQHLDVDSWVRGWIEKGGAAVRIHDSGDFFTADYLKAWLRIAKQFPDILFYAYTKEVSMFRTHAQDAPVNFRYVFSMGGKEDHLINKDLERHADVFPDEESMTAAGYVSQDESDLLCVLLPTTRIGIPTNNIPAFKKKLAGRTFAELQLERVKEKHVSR